MLRTFYDLPWFVREAIYDHVLSENKTYLAFPRVNDKYFVRAEPLNITYNALRLVSKSVSLGCRAALLRGTSILIERQHDLSVVCEALSSADIAVVRAVVIKVTHTYENDGLPFEDRTFDCLDVTFSSIKETFPNLKRLELDQDPGSVKMHSQLPYQKIAEDVIMAGRTRYFSNGWGFMANNVTLVGTAYGAMGSRLFEWFQKVIADARDDDVCIDITIRFHCAADPRLQREDITGSMNIDDGMLVVDHQGVTWRLPQEFDGVPSMLDVTGIAFIE